MRLVTRHGPAVYIEQELPANVTTSGQAIRYARRLARQHRLQVCLVLGSRRLWISKTGQIVECADSQDKSDRAPCIWLRGSNTRFLFRMKPINESEE